MGDVNEQLEQVEEDLGINQGWNVDTELGDDSRVDLIGHREALAMTLIDWIDNVDDAVRSGPSRQTDFLQLTGNFTNNSDATTRLYMQRVNALKSIALVDKNYALENNLHEAQAQMAAIVSQNKLLQKQLSCSNPCATVDSKGCVTFLEDTKRFESTINLCFTMPATFLFTKFVSNKLNNYLRYTTVALFR